MRKKNQSHIIHSLPSLLALCAIFCCSGCMSVNTSHEENVLTGIFHKRGKQIHVSNYGYYLFNSIPLGSGSASNIGSTKLFSDDANLDDVQAYLSRYAEENNYILTEVQPTITSTCQFSAIPFIGSTLGLFWYREVQISATLIEKE